jgi:hypothetical protein
MFVEHNATIQWARLRPLDCRKTEVLMVKRILDLEAKDLQNMSKFQKLQSIKAGEGRTIVSEVIGIFTPLLMDVSNVELAAAFGADIILLNLYDVDNPVILGFPVEENLSVINKIKSLTGRMIGVNLEPFDYALMKADLSISNGRAATLENAKKVIEQGADIILLTGNPKTDVSNQGILKSLSCISSNCGSNVILAAGKMHSAGKSTESGNKIIDKEIVKSLIDSGADIVLFPAPGTVPGISTDYIRNMIDFVHDQGKLAMTSIGTSQEGSDIDTIKRIAIESKMAGADLHHIGDSGMTTGLADPENIMAYSIVVKGKRHTYRRMAKSVNR